MSEARERYYKEEQSGMDLTRWIVIDFVTELKTEIGELQSDLKESRTHHARLAVEILNTRNKISELEAEKAELMKTLKQIKELSESFPCGYYEPDEFDEKDESPEDAILHTISVIRNKCLKELKKHGVEI